MALAESYEPQEEMSPMTQQHVVFSSFRSWQDFSVVLTEKEQMLKDLRLNDRLDKSCSLLPSLRDWAGEQPGSPCTIRKEVTSRWVRASYLETEADCGLVRLVDEGGNSLIHRDSIKPLPKDLSDVCPPVAMNCKISDSERIKTLPVNPLVHDGYRHGVLMIFVEKQEGCYLVELSEEAIVDHSATNDVGEEEAEEDEIKRQKLLSKVQGKGGKGSVNRKRVMTYEPCIVVKVYATCMQVEPLASGSKTMVMVSAEQCSLHGGSLRDARLDRLFKPRDHLDVSAHLNYTVDDSGSITDQEWVARDMRHPALEYYLRHGRYMESEFVTHGTISKVDDGLARIRSRLFQLDAVASLAAFSNGEEQATKENTSIEEMAPQFRTCAMRVRLGANQPEAVAVEVFHSIEDDGVLFMVRDLYSVILRVRECEDNMGERMECRYVFIPNGVIDAGGLQQDDWYGRPVIFVAVEDQPELDEGVPRWKGIKANLLYDPDNPQKHPRGEYKYEGIWRPRPIGGEDGMGRRRRDQEEESELDLPAGLVKEWKHEGLTGQSGAEGERRGRRQEGRRRQPEEAQQKGTESNRGQPSGIISSAAQSQRQDGPPVYRPVTSTQEIRERQQKMEEAARKAENESQRDVRPNERDVVAQAGAGVARQGSEEGSLRKEPEIALLVDITVPEDKRRKIVSWGPVESPQKAKSPPPPVELTAMLVDLEPDSSSTVQSPAPPGFSTIPLEPERPGEVGTGHKSDASAEIRIGNARSLPQNQNGSHLPSSSGYTGSGNGRITDLQEALKIVGNLDVVHGTDFSTDIASVMADLELKQKEEMGAQSSGN